MNDLDELIDGVTNDAVVLLKGGKNIDEVEKYVFSKLDKNQTATSIVMNGIQKIWSKKKENEKAQQHKAELIELEKANKIENHTERFCAQMELAERGIMPEKSTSKIKDLITAERTKTIEKTKEELKDKHELANEEMYVDGGLMGLQKLEDPTARFVERMKNTDGDQLAKTMTKEMLKRQGWI
ncbi:MAG: hypothetical protein KKH88_02115 [Nanoarchaeota archaeon]|nr:hypothetical protein [Nanoarchaeota archaeon]